MLASKPKGEQDFKASNLKHNPTGGCQANHFCRQVLSAFEEIIGRADSRHHHTKSTPSKGEPARHPHHRIRGLRVAYLGKSSYFLPRGGGQHGPSSISRIVKDHFARKNRMILPPHVPDSCTNPSSTITFTLNIKVLRFHLSQPWSWSRSQRIQPFLVPMMLEPCHRSMKTSIGGKQHPPKKYVNQRKIQWPKLKLTYVMKL